MSPELRRQIERFLAAYAWPEDLDATTALVHGVTEAEVRAIRVARSRRHAIARLSHELAELTGWTGSPGLMVEALILDALSKAAPAAQDVDGDSLAVPQTGAPGSGAVRAAVDRFTPDPADTSSSPVSGSEKSVSTATPKTRGSLPVHASAAARDRGRGHSGGSRRPPPDETALPARLLAP